MKKVFKFIANQIKYFFVNPFWSSKMVWLLVGVSLLTNSAIWFLYIKFYRELIGIIPISYALAVLILNIFLSNIIYRKQTLICFILLGGSALVQILFIIFLRLFAMSQAF